MSSRNKTLNRAVVRAAKRDATVANAARNGGPQRGGKPQSAKPRTNGKQPPLSKDQKKNKRRHIHESMLFGAGVLEQAVGTMMARVAAGAESMSAAVMAPASTSTSLVVRGQYAILPAIDMSRPMSELVGTEPADLGIGIYTPDDVDAYIDQEGVSVYDENVRKMLAQTRGLGGLIDPSDSSTIGKSSRPRPGKKARILDVTPKKTIVADSDGALHANAQADAEPAPANPPQKADETTPWGPHKLSGDRAPLDAPEPPATDGLSGKARREPAMSGSDVASPYDTTFIQDAQDAQRDLVAERELDAQDDLQQLRFDMMRLDGESPAVCRAPIVKQAVAPAAAAWGQEPWRNPALSEDERQAERQYMICQAAEFPAKNPVRRAIQDRINYLTDGRYYAGNGVSVHATRTGEKQAVAEATATKNERRASGEAKKAVIEAMRLFQKLTGLDTTVFAYAPEDFLLAGDVATWTKLKQHAYRELDAGGENRRRGVKCALFGFLFAGRRLEKRIAQGGPFFFEQNYLGAETAAEKRRAIRQAACRDAVCRDVATAGEPACLTAPAHNAD